MRIKACGLLVAFIGVAVLASARPAESSTINFAPLETSGTLVNTCCGALRTQGTSVSIDGFTFTSSNIDPTSYGLSVWDASDPSHPVGGSLATSLLEYAALATTTMTKDGGGTFTLTGIDLTEWGAGMFGGTGQFGVTIVGTKSDSTTVSQTFQVLRNAGSPQLQSFFLTDFDGLTQVTMQQGIFASGTAFQFNNLIVDEAASVPDGGSTLSLLSVAGLSLAALQRLARRQRV